MTSSVVEDDSVAYWDILPRRLVVICCAFALGVFLTVFQLDFVFVALCFILISCLKIFNYRNLHLALISLALLLGILDAALQKPRPPASSHLLQLCSKRKVSLEGRIAELKPSNSGKCIRILLETANGKVQLLVFPSKRKDEGSAGVPGLCEGGTVSVTGALKNLCESRQRANILASLMRKGIFFQMACSVKGIRVLSEGAPGSSEQKEPLSESESLSLTPESWRQRIVAFHRSVLGSEMGSLLSSMVIGDRAVSLEKATTDEFRAAGLSHVLAASGFNLSVVAGSIFFLLRSVGNIWITNLFCFLGMVTFVFVAGPSPSVLRAFLFGSIILISSCLGRKLHLPAALSLTMFLVLLFDPWSCSDLGFQLSYLATAAMIVAAGRLTQILQNQWRRCPGWILSALAAALVAQAAVLPLQLYYFGQFNSYCLPANVLVAPLVPVVTIGGFLASFLHLLEAGIHCPFSLALLVDKLCFYPMQLICCFVSFFARAPLALVDTAKASSAAVFSYYSVLFSYPFFDLKNRLRLWLLMFAFAFSCLFFTVLV